MFSPSSCRTCFAVATAAEAVAGLPGLTALTGVGRAAVGGGRETVGWAVTGRRAAGAAGFTAVLGAVGRKLCKPVTSA